jgi:uncharacterized protein with HEPN domain
MRRNDNWYLLDIKDAADRIAEYISGVERKDFLAHKMMMKAAVVREIEIIGEAAYRVSEAFKDAHPEIHGRIWRSSGTSTSMSMTA